MGNVHANQAGLSAMAKGDLDEPVVMLNLLLYRDRAEAGYGVDGLSGREAYEEYGRRFAELHPRFGGEPVWMGRAHHSIIGEDEWDIVILVRYPTRRQFLAMFDDPEYQKIAPIRAAALADSRLVEMSQLILNV
jgi:uncharacterized protein (DUF1330 family)